METKTNQVDPRILELFKFRNKKGDLKKIEIIEAAIEVLAEQGLEHTTYESLALKIDSRRAHVAYHFKDKKVIYLSAVKYILGRFHQNIVDSLELAHEQKKSPTDVLHAYIDSVFDWAKNNPSQLSIMLLLNYQCTLDTDYVELNDELRKGANERLALLFEHVGCVETNQLSGKWLQNQLAGSMSDSVNTSTTSLQDARLETHHFLNLLIG